MIYVIYYFIIGTIIVRLGWREVIKYLNDDKTKSRIFNDPSLILLKSQGLLIPIIFFMFVIVWPVFAYSSIVDWIRGKIIEIRMKRAISRLNKLLEKAGLSHLKFDYRKPNG